MLVWEVLPRYQIWPVGGPCAKSWWNIHPNSADLRPGGLPKIHLLVVGPNYSSRKFHLNFSRRYVHRLFFRRIRTQFLELVWVGTILIKLLKMQQTCLMCRHIATLHTHNCCKNIFQASIQVAKRVADSFTPSLFETGNRAAEKVLHGVIFPKKTKIELKPWYLRLLKE